MKKITVREEPIIFYPSVECGPLNINKAKRKLNWSPSPLESAIAKTNSFFIKAKEKYTEEVKKVEEIISKKLKIN